MMMPIIFSLTLESCLYEVRAYALPSRTLAPTQFTLSITPNNNPAAGSYNN
jgi:hypothetical protein